MKAPETIICVDCGGECKLLMHPEKEIEPGDVVAYRCLECMDRWDVVMEEEGTGYEWLQGNIVNLLRSILWTLENFQIVQN